MATVVISARVPRPGTLPAPLLVVGGIVSVQLGGALAKSVFAQVGATGAVTLRLVSAAVVMLVLFPRPHLRRADFGLVAVYGVCLALMNATFYESLSRVPIGAAVTVEFLGPLGVAVAGSRRLRDGLAVTLAAAGILLLARAGGHLDLLGLLLAALAGGFWACYILLSARVGSRHSDTGPLTVAMTVAAVLVLPLGATHAIRADTRSLVIGLGLGVLSSVIPYSLELAALRRLPANVFGVLMSLEPAVAAVAGLVILGETLHAGQWLGVGCVVSACAGVTAGRIPER